MAQNIETLTHANEIQKLAAITSAEEGVPVPSSVIMDYLLFTKRIISLQFGVPLESELISKLNIKKYDPSLALNGRYYFESKEMNIYIDPNMEGADYLNEVFSTVSHEAGHAYQKQLTQRPLLYASGEAFAEMVAAACANQLHSERPLPANPGRLIFGPGHKLYEYPTKNNREADGQQLLYVAKQYGLEKAVKLAAIPSLRLDPFSFNADRFFARKCPDFADKKIGGRLDSEVEGVLGINRQGLYEQFEKNKL